MSPINPAEILGITLLIRLGVYTNRRMSRLDKAHTRA